MHARFLIAGLLFLLQFGCGRKVPSNPVEQGMPASAGTGLTLADGSANVWKFETPKGGPATWVYDPVTPAESSTGTYSGGEPGNGTLTDAQVAELWARIAAIEADTSTHIDARAKGTWLVSVEGASPSQRMTSGGPAVDALVVFLGTVHTP